MRSLLFSLVVLAVVFMGCSGDKNTQNQAASVDKNTVQFAITGMVCEMGCAKTISHEVADMEGVISCDVDFEEGICALSYNANTVTKKEIYKHIEEMAGGQYKIGEEVEDKPQDVVKGSAQVRGDTHFNVSQEEVTGLFESVKSSVPQIFLYLLYQVL